MSTPTATPSDLLVLHALRCMGAVSAARVADAVGLAEAEVESELIDHGAAGLVTYHAGSVPAWRLTDAGRDADAHRIAAEIGPGRTMVAAAYDDFVVLNPRLLQICTDWQLRPAEGRVVANDHGDREYDAAVLDRLRWLHHDSDPMLARLASVAARFARYRTRLSGALAGAQAGATALVADDLDSYHMVWFQLHEDLLVTLGRPRW